MQLWKDVHIVITDEISMVSYETFMFIHQWLIFYPSMANGNKGTDDTTMVSRLLAAVAHNQEFESSVIHCCKQSLLQLNNG